MKFIEMIQQITQDKIFTPVSLYYGRKRNDLLVKFLNPGNNEKILDFGGADGRRMAQLFGERQKNIFIADINKKDLNIAKKKYGYNTILVNEDGEIPFENDFFDITFCNSVIEHVTINKDEIYHTLSGEEFKEKSYRRQRKLADEIRRVSKKYFVQTPNKHFIIESHTRFPSFYLYFPRKFQIKLIVGLCKYWIKTTAPDFNLLTTKDMRRLFPEATIMKEKFLFLTKSLIAIKN